MHRRRPPSAPALPKKILSLRRRLENLRKTARKLDRASSALGQLFRTLEESDHVYNELVFEAARDSHSVQKKVALAMGTDDAGRSTVLSVHPLSTDTSFHSRERRLFELQALETGLRHRLRSYAPPYTRKDMLVPMLEREAQYASLFLRHARMCQEHASMLRAEVLSAQRLLVTPTNTQNNKHATSRFVANVFADLHSITSLIDTLALRAKMLEQAEQSRVQPLLARIVRASGTSVPSEPPCSIRGRCAPWPLTPSISTPRKRPSRGWLKRRCGRWTWPLRRHASQGPRAHAHCPGRAGPLGFTSIRALSCARSCSGRIRHRSSQDRRRHPPPQCSTARCLRSFSPTWIYRSRRRSKKWGKIARSKKCRASRRTGSSWWSATNGFYECRRLLIIIMTGMIHDTV